MTPTSADSELEIVSSPGKSVSLREVSVEDARTLARLRLLWEHRGFLFKAALYGLLAATVVAFLIPKQYESTTRLMPPDEQSGPGMALIASLSGKMSGGLGGLAGDMLGVKNSGDLFVGILRSRTVQDDLVARFGLQRVYGKHIKDLARQKLAANTAISEDRKSGIIAITVTDRSPQRAAAMAQEYVVQLNTVVSQLSTSSARRERLFLEGRLREVKQDLETAEKDFSEFSSKNGAIDIQEQGRAMVEAAAVQQGQLIAAESELQGLKQIYADNNVHVRAVTARVAELRNQLEKLGGKAEIGKDLTDPQNHSLYPTIRQLPLLGVSYADLYRRTKVEEAVFETLTQEYELAKVAEAKEIPSVKVLDPAEVPERKSYPARLLIMLFGGVLGLAGAVVWVAGRARWQQAEPHNPQKIFAQEILRTVHATMPWAPPNGSRMQAFSHRIWLQVVGRNGVRPTEGHLQDCQSAYPPRTPRDRP